MVAEAFDITLIFSGLNKKLQRMFSQQQLIAPVTTKKTGCAAQEEVCVRLCTCAFTYLAWRAKLVAMH